MAKRKHPRGKRIFRLNIHILIDLLAVVLIWRGVWHLADIFLFPNNPVFSNLFGLIVGLIILLIDNHLFEEIDRHK